MKCANCARYKPNIFFRISLSSATASHGGFARRLTASPHIHPAHMERRLTKEDVPCRLSFTIQHLVSEMLLIACLPVSLGLGRNWYQLLVDFQTMLPWQPPWKALSLEQKEWHCQPTRFSIYKFHCTECECQISPLAQSVVFLTSSVGHCTLSVPLGGE